MAKKRMNKKLALKVGIGVLAFVSVSLTLGLINAETGFINKMVGQDHDSNGNYSVALGTTLVSKDSTKDYTQEVELVGENSPFEKMELSVKVYGEDETSRLNVTEDVVTASYVEEIEMTFTLAEDVEYYIGTIGLMNFGFVDTDDEEELDIKVKVGRTTYECISYSETIMFLNEVTISDDVVITITNPYADDEKVEAHEFTLGTIIFNALDQTSYTSVVEEE